MKKILQRHVTTFLIGITAIFLVIIVGYFVWGIGYLLMEVDQANNGQASNAASQDFDLNAAARLDYRGIAVATGTSQ